MNVKKFFKALSAGAQVTFEKFWGWLRFALYGCIGAGVVGTIVAFVIKNDFWTTIAGCVGGLIAASAVRVFDHCKKAVEYSEKHEVDMKTAWKKTYPEEYYYMN